MLDCNHDGATDDGCACGASYAADTLRDVHVEDGPHRRAAGRLERVTAVMHSALSSPRFGALIAVTSLLWGIE